MALEEEHHRQVWSTQPFRLKERFDAWRAMLNESHLNWTLDRSQREGFLGKVEMGQLGELNVVRCACDRCSGIRASQEIALDSSAYYGLLLIYAGHEGVECRGHDSLLGPGNFLVWDSTIPTKFRLHSRIHKITVFVPQDHMHDALPDVDNLVGKAFDWQRGLGAVTSSLISTLSSQTAHIDDRQAHATAETTLELIATCLWNEQHKIAGRIQQNFLTRIKNYIEAHLEDPNLRPQSLAQHFGISVRYVHQVFEAENISVSRWILERRLEHCRRELVRAGNRKTITEVAFRWGFNSSAHFSRVFKRHYGISPSEYRSRHTAQRLQ